MIVLVHWNAEEAETRVRRLRDAGFTARAGSLHGPTLMKEARDSEAIVIDLTRLPSHGREAALGFRRQLATRHVPLVFVEGDAAKVERLRALLPDATFTEWRRIGAALKSAMKRKVVKPVVPGDALSGYSGTPLPKKLGIREGSRVLLIDAPSGFERKIEPLPEDTVSLEEADLVLFFAETQAEMMRQFRNVSRRVGERAKVWIFWPKRTSGVQTDLTQQTVREFGLGSGWVDYKVCAVDATWSGLLFARRKT